MSGDSYSWGDKQDKAVVHEWEDFCTDYSAPPHPNHPIPPITPPPYACDVYLLKITNNSRSFTLVKCNWSSLFCVQAVFIRQYVIFFLSKISVIQLNESRKKQHKPCCINVPSNSEKTNFINTLRVLNLLELISRETTYRFIVYIELNYVTYCVKILQLQTKYKDQQFSTCYYLTQVAKSNFCD